MSKLWLRASVLAVALCGWIDGAYAQDDFEAQHRRAVAGNPQGLHLTIALEAGSEKFRIGDAITVQYRLTADSAGKYLAGLRAYDMARRSTLESFVVDHREETADPLAGFTEIYRAVYRDHSSSNSARDPVGPASPTSESFVLTRYLRFRQPGIYRVYVTTGQVVSADLVQDFFPATRGGPALTSDNILSFELRPRNDSESSREVDAIVNRATAGKPPRLSQNDAFRLFEIDTAQARQAAAQLYDYYHDDASALAMATMLAAPTRDEVIRLLQDRVRYDKQPVDRDLLQELALEQMLQQNPELTADVIASNRRVDAPWRKLLADQLLADFRAAVATIDQHTPPARALSAKFLHEMATRCNCSLPQVVSDQEKRHLRSLRLAGLTELPQPEQANELAYMNWADDISKNELLAALERIYQNLPEDSGSDFERVTVLRAIADLDRELAGQLFRRRIIDKGWVPRSYLFVQAQPINLPGAPELDDFLIKKFESRRTEDMENVAPIIGAFATAAILPRVKKIYEIYGANWPCSMQPGLLGYFLRTDPAYGVEQLRGALGIQHPNWDGACQSLLIDVARVFDAPELETFAKTVLDDPRPAIADIGLQVLIFNRISAFPYEALVARLHKLHDEWSDFASRKGDADYLKRWQTGYASLESRIYRELMRRDFSPEFLGILRQAYEFCVSETCRSMIRSNINSFPAMEAKKFSPLTDSDEQRILALHPQLQAEELLERSIEHDQRALRLLEQSVEAWTGKITMSRHMQQLEWRSRFSTDLRVRRANVDVNLALEKYKKNSATAEMLIARAKSDSERRSNDLYSLGMLGGRGVASKRVHQVLVEYAKNDRNPLVRQGAVEGLRFLGTDQALNDLYDSFLHDHDYRVRDRAGCNLAHCGIFTRKQRMQFVPKLVSVAANERLTAQMHDWVFLALRDITDESIADDASQWQKWQREHGLQKRQQFAAMAWWQVRGDE